MDFKKWTARIKNILVTPKTEWPLIAAEKDTVWGLFVRYVMILAAIPVVISLIAEIVVVAMFPIPGISLPLITLGIVLEMVIYVLSLAESFLMMWIVNALAPGFGGKRNPVQALKSIAYASTSIWLAVVLGIVFSLLPLVSLDRNVLPIMKTKILTALTVMALVYQTYLLYVGLPETMKCPQKKAGGYAVATTLIGVALHFIILASLVLAAMWATIGSMIKSAH